MARSSYNPSNWYWIVAGSTTQVYSSAADNYVPVADAIYQTWLAAGNSPTAIDSEQSLADVLAAAGEPLPPGTVVSDTQKNAWFADVPRAVQVWSFDIDNRVRVVEGLPTRTLQQFKNYVKGLM
jgi:hypothetical protein